MYSHGISTTTHIRGRPISSQDASTLSSIAGNTVCTCLDSCPRNATSTELKSVLELRWSMHVGQRVYDTAATCCLKYMHAQKST